MPSCMCIYICIHENEHVSLNRCASILVCAFICTYVCIPMMMESVLEFCLCKFICGCAYEWGIKCVYT